VGTAFHVFFVKKGHFLKMYMFIDLVMKYYTKYDSCIYSFTLDLWCRHPTKSKKINSPQKNMIWQN